MASSSIGILPVSIGLTVAALASGFGVCMFNLDTTGECLTLARTWVDTFRGAGNQMLVWGMNIVSGAFAK